MESIDKLIIVSKVLYNERISQLRKENATLKERNTVLEERNATVEEQLKENHRVLLKMGHLLGFQNCEN